MATTCDRRQFMVGAAAAASATMCTTSAACAAERKAKSASTESDAASDAAKSWLGEAPAVSDDDCAQTIDCEVLVVGAGCSGLVAANFAAMEGADTLLIEKYESGTGVRGSGLGAVGSRKQREQGVEIDPVEIANDFAHYALNNSSMDLYRLWTDNSGEAIDWYCDLVEGVDQVRVDLEWNMPEEKTRYTCWPTGHGSMLDNGRMGKDEASAEGVTYRLITEAFTSRENARLMYQTGLVSLIKEGGAVVGAYASDVDGNYLRINARKGVIVATGGYADNKDMYEARQAETEKSLVGVVPFPTFCAQGDGIKACLWAGAAMDDKPTSMVFDRGIMRPDQEIGHPFDMDFGYFHAATQPFLKVDSTGRRITNESSPYDFLVHAAATRGNRAWYSIWDANWANDIERFHTIGCSTLIKREGSNQMDPEGVDGTAAIIDSFVEDGHIIKADTLEELAEAFGFDTETFLATVDQYNGFYDAQNDTQYGKEPFRLSEIRTAPFYGVKLGGLLLCTLDGIRINDKFQALTENGEPIEGLYVIGNDSGCYYNGTYPNLAAGANAGRCVTFGMLCGRQVARL